MLVACQRSSLRVANRSSRPRDARQRNRIAREKERERKEGIAGGVRASERVDLIRDYCASVAGETATGKNGKSDNKVDVGGPKLRLPVDAVGTSRRSVHGRISPPFRSFPLSSSSSRSPRMLLVDVEASVAPMGTTTLTSPTPTSTPNHHLPLLFFSFSSFLDSVSLRSSRTRNMASRQKIRPSTPSLSRATPAARFLRYPRCPPLPHPPPPPLAPDTFLPPWPRAPFYPADPSLPAPLFRCILNQSLGGNAITRHHDASTIFYFKLLYVLVPPPCFPLFPR